MNTPKVRSWAPNSNLYSIWKKLSTKTMYSKKKSEILNCVFEKKLLLN